MALYIAHLGAISLLFKYIDNFFQGKRFSKELVSLTFSPVWVRISFNLYISIHAIFC